MSSKSLIVIQPDWNEALRDNERKIWAYYKSLGEQSNHGFLDDENFKVESKTGRSISVKYCPASDVITFVASCEAFSSIHLKCINSMDVASGGLGVSASVSNELFIWETSTGLVRRRLEGHVFDAYTCRFFPSGLVILSGGADMQLKIWDAASGICPVSLVGHTAAVTDLAIIDRGKNVVSVSKDGTAKLWNCAQSKCIDTLVEGESEMSCCAITSLESLEEQEVLDSDLEFGTQGKVLAVGCVSSKLILVNVGSRKIMATYFMVTQVHAFAWLTQSVGIAGLEDGSLMSIDAEKPSQLPQVFAHHSASAVLSLCPAKGGIFVGRRDGVTQFYRAHGTSSLQLSGPNCDPVTSISTDGMFIFTAGRDSVIRKYDFNDMHL